MVFQCNLSSRVDVWYLYLKEQKHHARHTVNIPTHDGVTHSFTA